MLRRFAEQANSSFAATADDLVTVRVGGGLNVTAVDILERSLNADLKQRLETAIMGAVNIAMQRAALAAGQAIGDLERTKRSGKNST